MAKRTVFLLRFPERTPSERAAMEPAAISWVHARLGTDVHIEWSDDAYPGHEAVVMATHGVVEVMDSDLSFYLTCHLRDALQAGAGGDDADGDGTDDDIDIEVDDELIEADPNDLDGFDIIVVDEVLDDDR